MGNYCRNCGHEINFSDNYCGNCGHQVFGKSYLPKMNYNPINTIIISEDTKVECPRCKGTGEIYECATDTTGGTLLTLASSSLKCER